MSAPSPRAARRLLAVSPVATPGGAEIGLLRLLRRLDPDRWAVVLASPAGPGLPDAAEREGWPWHELDCGPLSTGPAAAARAMRSWPRARRLARGHDVVYLNGTVCGRLLPALPNAVRTVLHVHDLVRRTPVFWRRADLVLADSSAVAERLAGLAAHVVGCPVELDPPAVEPPWLGARGPVVGFVGRIEPRKGPLDLVRAAPLILRGRPDARIVLVGGDPYASDPEYVARVRSEGVAADQYPWVQEAPGLMRHLDVLVAPSHAEPFGTVLAEAMAVGTPVVSARSGGVSEVVPDGRAGRLVEPGQPAALASAVLWVLERRESLRDGAREAAARFAADGYARTVEELLMRDAHPGCTVAGRA